MSRCAFCTRNTDRTCPNCSKHTPTERLVYYCCKTCEGADYENQSNHRVQCTLSVFYSRLRHLYKPTKEFVIQLSDQLEVPRYWAVHMFNYLCSVPTSARPRYLVSVEPAKLRREIVAFQALLPMAWDDVDEYMASWEITVPMEERAKLGTWRESAVPFRHRPFVDHHIDEFAFEEVMEVYPKDFELLPFGEFVRLFSEEGKARAKFWVVKS